MTDGIGVGEVRRCAWGRMSSAALRPRYKLVGALAMSVLFAGMVVPAVAQTPSAKSTQSALPQTETRKPTRQQVAAIAGLPLIFEKNMGQVDKRAGYLSRMSSYTLFLTGSDSILTHSGKANNTASALRLRWLGASSAVTPQGDTLLRGKSNYLIGNDRSQWHSNVPNYQRVKKTPSTPASIWSTTATTSNWSTT